jgi:DNA invertase Pin-like site-specific DNA recombinase
VLLRQNIINFFLALVMYAVISLVAYLIGKMVKNDLRFYIGGGLFGLLVIEWYLVGFYPGSGKAGIHVTMFTNWAAVFTVPRLFTSVRADPSVRCRVKWTIIVYSIAAPPLVLAMPIPPGGTVAILMTSQKDVGGRYSDYLMKSDDMLSKGYHLEDLEVSALKVAFRDRPQGKVLDEILQPGDHVVFARLDRAFRNVDDMRNTICKSIDGKPNWIDRGITAHFVDQQIDTSKAGGRAMLTILTAVAEWEASLMSERGIMIANCLRSQGRPRNQEILVGYKIMKGKLRGKTIKRFVLDFEQVDEIHQIAMMKDYAGMGFEGISDFLEDAAAKREGRKPIPRLGKIVHPSKLPKLKRPRKEPAIHRRWTRQRCLKAHKIWPEIQTTLRLSELDCLEEYFV